MEWKKGCIRSTHQLPAKVDYCSCGQVHRLSAWGFLLLENVEATLSLGLRWHSLLSIYLVEGGVKGDVLKAISSTLTRQKGRVKKLEAFNMECQNKETAESIATILTNRNIILICPRVLVTEEIWKEGRLLRTRPKIGLK